MNEALHTALLGPPDTNRRRSAVAGVLVGVFVAVFALYALGFFAVAGGAVFVPREAAAIGGVVAAWFAYRERGLVRTWLAVYAALLGFAAEFYVLGVTHRPLLDRLALVLQPDGLVFLGAEAVGLGTVAWIVGSAANRLVSATRR